MFSPGQASELLEIPPSTLRRYAKLFEKYLSEGARKKRRTYTETDLSKLKQIKELLDAGSTIKEVPDQLGKTLEVQKEDTSTALALPGLIEQLKEFQSIFEQQQQEIEEHKQALIYLAKRFKQIEKRDQQRQHQEQEVIILTERVDQLQEWINTPWYRKVGKKPPE